MNVSLCVQVQAWEVCIRGMCICRQTHKQCMQIPTQLFMWGYPHPVLPDANPSLLSSAGSHCSGERASLQYLSEGCG